MRIASVSMAAALVAALWAPSVSAAGNAATGKEIALRWCAACHLVADEQESGSAAVPGFREIARQGPEDLSVLEGFLADPHPLMPDMSLTRQEIRDLVAYIGSLR